MEVKNLFDISQISNHLKNYSQSQSKCQPSTNSKSVFVNLLEDIKQRKIEQIAGKDEENAHILGKMKVEKLTMEQAETAKIESSNRFLNLTSEELTHQFESYTDSLRFEIELRDDNMMRFLTCAYRRELQLQPGIVGSFDDMRQLLYGFLFKKSWYRHNLRYGTNTGE